MPTRSISTRLNIALVAIIAAIMTAFAVLATLFTVDRISQELDTKLANYLRISSVSLEAPLWNFDHGVVEGYLDALMLDETVAYANVSSPDGTVTNRARPELAGRSFVEIAASEDYKARDGGVLKDGEEISRIELVLSRAAVQQEIVTNIVAIVTLALLVLATITAASIVISRRFVARPLANLQNSAAAIGSGDLQTEIDTEGLDEIGIHTDSCTVGNFGSESRLDYTIIGRAVNAAARIESAGEPGKILMSYATHAQVSDEIPCRSRGQIEKSVYGAYSAPASIFQLVEHVEQDGLFLFRQPTA